MKHVYHVRIVVTLFSPHIRKYTSMKNVTFQPTPRNLVHKLGVWFSDKCDVSGTADYLQNNSRSTRFNVTCTLSRRVNINDSFLTQNE